MKAQFKAAVIAAALCVFSAVQADARTLYVNAKAKNNKGSGLSVKAAKKTIQAAINIAKAGDTILVYPGTYAPIKTNNKKITIKSVKGVNKTRIIKPNRVDLKIALAELGKPYTIYLDTKGAKGKSGIYTRGTNSTITGFLLDGKNRTIGSDGQLVGISGGKAKSCVIQRIGNKYADTFGGFPSFAWDCHPVANASLTDCTLKNNRSEEICLSYGGPVSKTGAYEYTTGVSYGGSATAFQRCKIQGNDCRYGFGEGASLVNCLVAENTVVDELFDNNTLINCTVAKNTIYLKWGEKFSVGSKYYNCIFWLNYSIASKEVKTVYGYEYYSAAGDWIGYRSANETPFTIDVADAIGNSDSVSVTEATLSNYYPGYTKQANFYTTKKPGTKKTLHNTDRGNTYENSFTGSGDPGITSAYKLKNGSPCVNKGVLTRRQKKIVGAKDLAGQKRVKGKAIDLGCYEL